MVISSLCIFLSVRIRALLGHTAGYVVCLDRTRGVMTLYSHVGEVRGKVVCISCSLTSLRTKSTGVNRSLMSSRTCSVYS